MSGLVEFLLEQIAEDQAVAEAAVMEGHEWGGARWMVPEGTMTDQVCIDNGRRWGGATVVYDEGSPSAEQAAHIARHDPARVLAECEAKRAQIDHLVRSMESDYAPWNEQQLRIMAVVYADRPGYREEWRP